MPGNKVLEFQIWASNMVRRGVMAARSEMAGLHRVVNGLQSAGRGLSSVWSGVRNLFLKVAAGVGIAAGALALTIKKAFEFERYTVQFKTLFGSLEKAKAHMKDLAGFSARTPFEMAGIVQASRSLYVFSEGAMGTVESLRMVGDAASAVGMDIQDVALWVGRAYAMIKGGKPFGEAAMRLSEMGILTAKGRSEMERLQEAGASAAEVFDVLRTDLRRFEGAMESASTTGEGLVSTLKDNLNLALAEFGSVFVEDAKGALQSLIEWLNKLSENGTITAWAQKAREAIGLAAEVAKAIAGGGEGRTKALQALADVILGAFQTAVGAAVDFLIKVAPVIGDLIGKAAKDAFSGTRGGEMSVAVDQLRAEGKLGSEGRKKGITRSEQRKLIEDRTDAIHKANLEAEGKAAATAAGERGGKTWTELGEARMKRGIEGLASFKPEKTEDLDARKRAEAEAAAKKKAQKAADDKAAAEQKAKEDADLRSGERKKAGEAKTAIGEITKTEVGRAAYKKATEAKGPPKGDTGWIQVKDSIDKLLPDMKAGRAERLKTKAEDLEDRRRQFALTLMKPADQITATKTRIADLSTQKEKEKAAGNDEAALDLAAKIQEEIERLGGLTADAKKARERRDISLGDVFARIHGQDTKADDPLKRQVALQEEIRDTLKRIEGKGGMNP